MIPLEDDDLVAVYLHIPTQRTIGLTRTTNGHLLKVQLSPLATQIEWGNIAVWNELEKDIFHGQTMRGEIEWLKPPSDLLPTHFSCQGWGTGWGIG